MRNYRKACGAMTLILLAAAPCQARAEEQSDDSPPVIAELAPGEWRVSKLIGISVYDLAGEKVGRIADVVIDHDGAAKAAVSISAACLGSARSRSPCPSRP